LVTQVSGLSISHTLKGKQVQEEEEEEEEEKEEEGFP